MDSDGRRWKRRAWFLWAILATGAVLDFIARSHGLHLKPDGTPMEATYFGMIGAACFFVVMALDN